MLNNRVQMLFWGKQCREHDEVDERKEKRKKENIDGIIELELTPVFASSLFSQDRWLAAGDSSFSNLRHVGSFIYAGINGRQHWRSWIDQVTIAPPLAWKSMESKKKPAFWLSHQIESHDTSPQHENSLEVVFLVFNSYPPCEITWHGGKAAHERRVSTTAPPMSATLVNYQRTWWMAQRGIKLLYPDQVNVRSDRGRVIVSYVVGMREREGVVFLFLTDHKRRPRRTLETPVVWKLEEVHLCCG